MNLIHKCHCAAYREIYSITGIKKNNFCNLYNKKYKLTYTLNANVCTVLFKIGTKMCFLKRTKVSSKGEWLFEKVKNAFSKNVLRRFTTFWQLLLIDNCS